MSSGPWLGLTRFPFSTFHSLDGFGLSGFHPVRSLPLNNWTGFPHFGSAARFKDGARCPVHFHGVPSGPVVLPDKVLPASVPSKTMSSLRSSSAFGETNLRRPLVILISGSGRAFPQRPTNCALSSPFSC